MCLDEIVIREVKRNSRLKVFHLLAECIGQARQPAHVKASRSVQSLNVAGRNQVHIGSAHNCRSSHGGYFRRTVAAFLMMLAFVCAVVLNDHSVVNIHAESVLYGFDIGA